MKFIAERNELRLATLLVGAIQVLWSVLPGVGADFRLARVLDYYQQAEEWFVIMASLGILLIIGSTCRWRGGRHIAQILSCAMWASYCVLYLRYMVEVKWIVGTVFMTAPLLSVFCFALFVNDVAQKPISKGGNGHVVA